MATNLEIQISVVYVGIRYSGCVAWQWRMELQVFAAFVSASNLLNKAHFYHLLSDVHQSVAVTEKHYSRWVRG
jgi:hypothetical protein